MGLWMRSTNLQPPFRFPETRMRAVEPQPRLRSVAFGCPGCTASMMTRRRGFGPRPWRAGFLRPSSVGSLSLIHI